MNTRANATHGTIDNASADPRTKRSSMAKVLYPNHSGNMLVDPTVVRLGKPEKPPAGGDTSDAWRGGAVATPNGAVATKGAVPVKQAKELPGNQGANNSHTKPGKIKPVGSREALRKTGSVTTTRTLAPIGDAEAKRRTKALYPSSGSDTGRKL